MLAKSKLDSMETLVSQPLIDMKISHEEFNAIIREKQKYERMKENVENVSECSSAEKEESIFLCVCIKWTHLLYSLQTYGEKAMLKQ